MTDQADSVGSPKAGCSTKIPAVWPDNQLVPARAGLLVVLSGPSGSGKDAVIAALDAGGFTFRKIVTATTRPMRPNEIPGKDYHFVSTDEFYRWRDAGRLLEWAEVYGTPYGTPIDGVREALEAGETVLLKIDVQGAAQVKLKAPDAVFIFLGPGSFEELVGRLRRRGTEDDADFNRRVQAAREELGQLPHYDYLVINRQGELTLAVEQVKAIITAERLRIHPRRIDLP